MTKSEARAAAFDASTYARPGPDGETDTDLQLRKTRAAVNYFEREAGLAREAVERLADKPAKFAEYAAAAEKELAAARAEVTAADKRVADAREQLTKLQEG